MPTNSSVKPYFDLHPAIPYTFDPTVDPTNYTAVTDIVNRRAAFRKVVKDFSVAFYDLIITDAESTPEILSAKLYGSPNYFYIILLANEIYSVFTQWPKPQNTFFRFLQKKYGQDLSDIQKLNWTIDELGATPSPVHSFYSWNGRQIDYSTYVDHFTNNISTEKPYFLTYYDYEDRLNESLRNITVPRPQYVSRIHNELYNLMATSSF